MYVVLVILIALWAMVLLPPYLKDRRASGRTFGPVSSSNISGVNSAQRFLPLQRVSGSFSTSAVSSPTGMRTTGVNTRGTRPKLGAPGANPIVRTPMTGAGTPQPGNVVQLRPIENGDIEGALGGQMNQRAPLATSATAYLQETPQADELLLQQALDSPARVSVGMPASTASARERRRQVLITMTGLALLTLLFAIFAGGRWTAVHVLVDVVMLGYVILLVRHRQIASDRLMKVEPIRPPVSEQPPASVQLAPSYLLRSKTGS